MASHALDQRLFEQTAALGENDPLTTTTSPADGVTLINGWLTALKSNGSTERIEQKLQELNGQLQLATPDPDRIRDLLMTLADHTSQLAQGSNVQEPTTGKLENVATALRKFAGSL